MEKVHFVGQDEGILTSLAVDAAVVVVFPHRRRRRRLAMVTALKLNWTVRHSEVSVNRSLLHFTAGLASGKYIHINVQLSG